MSDKNFSERWVIAFESYARRGTSQEKIAEMADIHVNHRRRIELGQANPTYLVIVRIASAVDLPIAELLPER